MIYLKDKKVCILEKPKCASTSLSKAIFFAYKGKSNLFRSNKDIASVNFNYSNPQYIHCNLEGAIKKVKEISGSTEGVTFISTIRNPQSLVNSMYYFGLNNKNPNHQYSSVEEMINTKHYKSLTDIHFFKGYESINLKTFDTKNLKSLEKYLYDNFDIKISIKKLNKNKKNKKNLIFSKDVEDKINKDFFIFFEKKFQ